MTETDPVADAAFKYGWASAMARAVTLTAQLSPEGIDRRLRSALIAEVDKCPPLDLIKTPEAK